MGVRASYMCTESVALWVGSQVESSRVYSATTCAFRATLECYEIYQSQSMAMNV
jgi:hypothetical protein